MDREEIARARRRQQALEALEQEREREAALREQLEETVAELHGPAVDEAAFSRMAPEEVELIRDAFEGVRWEDSAEGYEDEDDPFAGFAIDDALDLEPEETESLEDEIRRLERELEESRRRQRAFERYLQELGA